MCAIEVGSFRPSQPTNTAHQAHPPRSPIRLLFSSIHMLPGPARGAALCTRELLELLAARGMDCRMLTTGIYDPDWETALDEVLGRPGTPPTGGSRRSCERAERPR